MRRHARIAAQTARNCPSMLRWLWHFCLTWGWTIPGLYVRHAWFYVRHYAEFSAARRTVERQRRRDYFSDSDSEMEK